MLSIVNSISAILETALQQLTKTVKIRKDHPTLISHDFATGDEVIL